MSDSTVGGAISAGSPGSVPELQQPSEMTCWATVATMLVSARDGTSYPIETVVDMAGEHYRQKFDNGEGLEPGETEAFLTALDLRAEPPQSFTVGALASLISSYGPLWITGDEDPGERYIVHARVIEAMEGDGTPDGTVLTVIDPEIGGRILDSFADTMRNLEAVASGDVAAGEEFRIQVIHF